MVGAGGAMGGGVERAMGKRARVAREALGTLLTVGHCRFGLCVNGVQPGMQQRRKQYRLRLLYPKYPPPGAF